MVSRARNNYGTISESDIPIEEEEIGTSISKIAKPSVKVKRGARKSSLALMESRKQKKEEAHRLSMDVGIYPLSSPVPSEHGLEEPRWVSAPDPPALRKPPSLIETGPLKSCITKCSDEDIEVKLLSRGSSSFRKTVAFNEGSLLPGEEQFASI